jgi:hypothetical protein
MPELTHDENNKFIILKRDGTDSEKLNAEDDIILNRPLISESGPCYLDN